MIPWLHLLLTHCHDGAAKCVAKAGPKLDAVARSAMAASPACQSMVRASPDNNYEDTNLIFANRVEKIRFFSKESMLALINIMSVFWTVGFLNFL
jgi:hypothetical protein